MSALLQQSSIVLIGEKFPTRVVWRQMYDTRARAKEEEIRSLMMSVSHVLLAKRIPAGSARKLDERWKVLYYETKAGKNSREIVYCLLTEEMALDVSVKKAMKSVVQRGGVYSPDRFFSEFLDLLEQGEEEELTIKEALEFVESYDGTQMLSINQLGRIISLLRHGSGIDAVVLEKIYFMIYESILEFELEGDGEDIDIGLDGAFSIAELYHEQKVFHLALELYKHIYPLAYQQNRNSLAVTCQIRIAEIYHEFFPMSSDSVIEWLSKIDKDELSHVTQSERERYYSLKGQAFEKLEKLDEAEKAYVDAILVAESNISQPKHIFHAHAFLGSQAAASHFPSKAIHNYLTAASLAFSGGDIHFADHYRSSAAEQEFILSEWNITSALKNRAEKKIDDAIYETWLALRYLLTGLSHLESKHRLKYFASLEDTMSKAKILFDIKGHRRLGKSVVNKITNLIEDLKFQRLNESSEAKNIQSLINIVEYQLPTNPPIFLLIAPDGRLVTHGLIEDGEWKTPDLEGVLFSGILSAIMALLAEVSESSLRTIDAGNFHIVIERDSNGIAVLLVDRESTTHRESLRKILSEIYSLHKNRLKYWDGGNNIVPDVKRIAIEVLTNENT